MMEMVAQSWWRVGVAEFLGVFTLVFAGAGSIVAFNQGYPSDGSLPEAAVYVGVALAHGLAIAVMITALGHISGGHFNPAVTAGIAFTGRMKLPVAALYWVFQILGGVAGAVFLYFSLPEGLWQPVHLGTPMLNDSIGAAKGFLIETWLTFFLVLVVFGSAVDPRNKSSVVAALAIGFTVTLGGLVGGPLTGAAMNPARAFGPALISSTWTDHAVYWVGPILGGILAGLVYQVAFMEPEKKPAAAEATSTPSTAPSLGTPPQS